MTTKRDQSLFDIERNRTVVQYLETTETTWEATVGLLGRNGLAADTGLLIRDCRCLHMFFMRFAIDVVYLDRDFRVVKVVSGLRPWWISGCYRAAMAVELPAGAAAAQGIEVGQALCLMNNDNHSFDKSEEPGAG